MVLHAQPTYLANLSMKSSNPSKYLLVEHFLKNTIRRPSQWGLPLGVIRQGFNQLSRLLPVQSNVKITPMQIAGCAVEWLQPHQPSTDQVIFHIHGGAFFLGGLASHRALVSDLAVYNGCSAIHVDYPLAPEQPFPKAIDAIHAVYMALIAQGIEPKKLIVSGDSCGGNLAMVLCLRLKELQQPLPAGVVLLSPWLDLTLSSPSLNYNRRHDALLSLQALRAGLHFYVGQRLRHDNPQLSPLLDDLTGLPPTLLQVGSKEILLDDSKRFYQQAKAQGVRVSCQVYTGMWHNFHMFGRWFPEARDALNDIAAFIRQL